MDITTKNILPTKTWIYIIFVLTTSFTTATFTLTLIYSEFLTHGTAISTQSFNHNKDVVALEEANTKTNDRIDKKTGRNKEFIDKINEDLEEIRKHLPVND